MRKGQKAFPREFQFRSQQMWWRAPPSWESVDNVHQPETHFNDFLHLEPPEKQEALNLAKPNDGSFN
jgi:hypothetical protein